MFSKHTARKKDGQTEREKEKELNQQPAHKIFDFQSVSQSTRFLLICLWIRIDRTTHQSQSLSTHFVSHRIVSHRMFIWRLYFFRSCRILSLFRSIHSFYRASVRYTLADNTFNVFLWSLVMWLRSILCVCVVFAVVGGGIIADFHLQKVRAKQNKTKQETIKSESVPYSPQNVHIRKQVSTHRLGHIIQQSNTDFICVHA